MRLEEIARATRHSHIAAHHARELAREGKAEPGALDEDAQAADLLQEYEAKIAAFSFDVSPFEDPRSIVIMRSWKLVRKAKPPGLAKKGFKS
jgi:hypothetical protein